MKQAMAATAAALFCAVGAIAADEDKLHGEWIGKDPEGVKVTLTFGPKNTVELSGEDNRCFKGTYVVDLKPAPHHLDIRWEEPRERFKTGKFQTIFEFKGKDQIRIALSNEDGRRPRELTDQAVVLKKESAAEKLVPRVYQVADLLVPGKGQTTFQDLILKIVTQAGPAKSWVQNGGRGTADYFPLGLAVVVNQTEEVHRQIAALLEAMRQWQEQMAPATERAKKDSTPK